jgi:hypothetical protein
MVCCSQFDFFFFFNASINSAQKKHAILLTSLLSTKPGVSIDNLRENYIPENKGERWVCI